MEANELAAKVKAVNTANAYALDLYPRLLEVFRPLVGEQIEKADGTLLAKVAKLVPQMPCSDTVSVYKYASDYSLAYVVKTCITFPSRDVDCQIACYHETTVYIGNKKNGVLVDVVAPPKLRTDYTVEQVQELRQAYRAARMAAHDARSNLYPFGEY